MGDVEISSEFEYSASFLRILIPGITVTILVSFLLNLNCSQYLSFLKKSIAESVWALLPLGVTFALLPLGVTFVFVSMFIGLLIYVVINPLIRVLEGYTLELYKKKIFYKDSGYA
jgi:membrane protein insertase Oxa1/YidC/SpoIIIJ